MGELRLMKGNEALAEAAIRAGMDGYFGYPITRNLNSRVPDPRSIQTHKTVVLQAESEVAAINMVYGGAGSGARVWTSLQARASA